ncbi:MAG: glycosyltransferase 87 family protein [Chloroflexota bacterium]|nr:glycosyltransferase 87 family protein [Chloroflexota bacterium]
MARIIAVAIVVGIGIATVIWAVTDVHFNDLDSYRAAALRIRAGEQLYGGDVGPFNKYYYAPWFAYAFVPLSYLPWELLAAVWTAFMVLCSGVAVWPLVNVRTPHSLVAAAIFGPTLLALSMSGNVHALMLAILVLLLPTRWGPIAVGVAASLKATPILLTIAYIGRGEWGRAAWAGAVSVLLWSPILLFEIAPVTFDSGGAALSLAAWLGLAAIGAVAALIATIRWPRHRWLASAAAVYMSTPRLYVYDVTILVVAAPTIWKGFAAATRRG